MQVTQTQIPDVLVLESILHRDSRGYFQETFRRDAFHDAGVNLDWMQDNISVSAKNVVRGLHYQVEVPQAKLVRVIHGAVFDVAVDLRQSSPTFGKHVAIHLEAGDGKALLIPAGFAHGFAALEPDTAFLYKIDGPRHPQGERTILWNDAQLGIAWPLGIEEAVLSERDKNGTPLGLAETYS
jgi:dTDP-4-dehydrorhamnose 3,5-epimerase